MDVYKVLKNQIQASPGTVTYQVPPAAKTQVGGGAGPVPSPLATSINTQSLVTNVFICNLHALDSADVSIDVSNYNTSSPIVTSLYSDIRIYPKNTIELTLNLTLKESDELQVVISQVGATTPTLHVTVFGIEMTTGNGPHA